jgi:hypothetical protein
MVSRGIVSLLMPAATSKVRYRFPQGRAGDRPRVRTSAGNGLLLLGVRSRCTHHQLTATSMPATRSSCHAPCQCRRRFIASRRMQPPNLRQKPDRSPQHERVGPHACRPCAACAMHGGRERVPAVMPRLSPFWYGFCAAAGFGRSVCCRIVVRETVGQTAVTCREGVAPCTSHASRSTHNPARPAR